MRKNFKISYNSPVILSFVLLCAAALLFNQITGGWSNQMFFMTYRSGLTNPLTYVRLLTHVLGHANLEHFTGNMIFILLIGPLLEEKYGSRAILLVIVTTALATGIANMILTHHALLGASGVVFAFIILSSITGFQKGSIPLTFVIVCILYLGSEIIKGVFIEDQISNLTHIIGGIVPIVLLKTRQIR